MTRSGGTLISDIWNNMVNFIHYFGYLEFGYMEFPLIWDILAGTIAFLASGIVCTSYGIPERGWARPEDLFTVVRFGPSVLYAERIQSWPKQCVLDCVISPLLLQAESRNLEKKNFGQLCRI